MAVNVTDLDRSIAFYSTVLGYRLMGTWDLAGAGMEQGMRLPSGAHGRNAFLRGSSVLGQVELVQWSVPSADRTPVRPGEPGHMLLSFWVEADEIDAVYARFVEAGGTGYSAPARVDIDGTEIRVFVGEDPDGTMLEFLVRPERAAAAAGASAARIEGSTS